LEAFKNRVRKPEKPQHFGRKILLLVGKGDPNISRLNIFCFNNGFCDLRTGFDENARNPHKRWSKYMKK